MVSGLSTPGIVGTPRSSPSRTISGTRPGLTRKRAPASADTAEGDGEGADPLVDIRHTRRIERVIARGVLHEPSELLAAARASRGAGGGER